MSMLLDKRVFMLVTWLIKMFEQINLEPIPTLHEKRLSNGYCHKSYTCHHATVLVIATRGPDSIFSNTLIKPRYFGMYRYVRDPLLHELYVLHVNEVYTKFTSPVRVSSCPNSSVAQGADLGFLATPLLQTQ